jgi:hypothetical protein
MISSHKNRFFMTKRTTFEWSPKNHLPVGYEDHKRAFPFKGSKTVEFSARLRKILDASEELDYDEENHFRRKRAGGG